MKKLLCALLFLYSGVTLGAKVQVELVTPTQNEDGTTLTDLAQIKVSWGTCNGSAFGTYQASVILPFTQTGVKLTTFIYPTGLTRVCAVAYAINSSGVSSVASNVAWKDLLPATGKPVTLGQPVILNFVQPDQELF